MYIEYDVKWKTRMRQIHTADPLGMGRRSCQYTIFGHSVQARLNAHTDWISCMYLVQYPSLLFWVLFYRYTTYYSKGSAVSSIQWPVTTAKNTLPIYIALIIFDFRPSHFLCCSPYHQPFCHVMHSVNRRHTQIPVQLTLFYTALKLHKVSLK